MRTGMSTALKISMVAILILIIALVVLGVFLSGTGNYNEAMNNLFSWVWGHQIEPSNGGPDGTTDNTIDWVNIKRSDYV